MIFLVSGSFGYIELNPGVSSILKIYWSIPSQAGLFFHCLGTLIADCSHLVGNCCERPGFVYDAGGYWLNQGDSGLGN